MSALRRRAKVVTSTSPSAGTVAIATRRRSGRHDQDLTGLLHDAGREGHLARQYAQLTDELPRLGREHGAVDSIRVVDHAGPARRARPRDRVDFSPAAIEHLARRGGAHVPRSGSEARSAPASASGISSAVSKLGIAKVTRSAPVGQQAGCAPGRTESAAICHDPTMVMMAVPPPESGRWPRCDLFDRGMR